MESVDTMIKINPYDALTQNGTPMSVMKNIVCVGDSEVELHLTNGIGYESPKSMKPSHMNVCSTPSGSVVGGDHEHSADLISCMMELGENKAKCNGNLFQPCLPQQPDEKNGLECTNELSFDQVSSISSDERESYASKGDLLCKSSCSSTCGEDHEDIENTAHSGL